MRIPRIRAPKIMDVIRVDGRLHVVRRIDFPGAVVGTEPLGDTLARNLTVGEQSMRLGDALIEAGWRPPADDIVS